MASKPTSSDIFDINKKTGALILGKNRLDDYATKYLTRYCKKALETPMPLPVDEILQEAGLTVKEEQLSKNLDIFGCCLLLDGEVEIYDRSQRTSHTVSFPAGTVLIDPDSEAMLGEGAKRNTLIHEALHWEKDKTYFQILAIKNTAASEKLYPIMCRQSETFYEPPEGKKTKENEVKWLEWQAHRIAPRVLMPFEMFKKKALEFIDSYQQSNGEIEPLCDKLIEDLSEFFIVSRASVKYRLNEVGLLEYLSTYDDYKALFEEINSSDEFVPITAAEAYQLINTESSFREWVVSGQFLFAEGYFVLANTKYVVNKEDGLHLTAKARRNLAKCVINIRKQKYTSYRNVRKDLMGFAVLYNAEGVDKRMITFHPKYQSEMDFKEEEVYAAFRNQILKYDEGEEKELLKRLGDPATSLCQCLWYIIEKRNWHYPAKFNDMTGLHKNYLGKIKNDNYNNMGTEVLMAICVSLRLNLRIIEKIFDKSKNKLNYYEDPDKTYVRILENMPGLSRQDFNGVLKQAGIRELGTTVQIDPE